MNTIYGYARVSTVKQDLNSQVDDLKRKCQYFCGRLLTISLTLIS